MANKPLTRETESSIASVAFRNLAWWVEPDPSPISCLPQFESIALEQMAAVALMDRTETKFVLHERALVVILPLLTQHYRVLDIDGTRLNHYRTLYFDTNDFALYRRHQAGGRNRYKVRSRHYIDSDLAFLEVKHKIRKDRTLKHRIQTDRFVSQLSSHSSDFLNAHLPQSLDNLEPKLWNEYSRFTLVGIDRPERVTIDLNLQFYRDGQTVVLPGIVVAEVKQTRLDFSSPVIQALRASGIRPTGFSKYCLGVLMLYAEVKHNNFKPIFLMLNHLIQGGFHVQ